MSIWSRKKSIIILFIVVLISCTSCGVQSTDKQKVMEKNSIEENYPYANSTDIFMTENNRLFSYDINGNNKRKLEAKIAEDCLLKLTDKWLYYKKEITKGELYNTEIEAVYRIPLKKGKDGRSIIAGVEEKVIDKLDGVTEVVVVNDYLVYIRSASCVNYNNNLSGIDATQEEDEIYSVNLKNKETKKCNIPKEIVMRKSLEWKMIGYSQNGIIWGEEVLFFFDFDKNEIIVIDKNETDGAVYNSISDEVYYCKDGQAQELIKYNIKKARSTIALDKKDILSVLVNCLGVLTNEITSFNIVNSYYYNGDIYISVKTELKENFQRYVLLVYHTNKNLLTYEPNLDNAKHLYSSWNERNENMTLLGCVQGNWFFEGEKGLLKYNSKTRSNMLCDLNKTGNEIYAIVNKKELGEGKVCD